MVEYKQKSMKPKPKMMRNHKANKPKVRSLLLSDDQWFKLKELCHSQGYSCSGFIDEIIEKLEQTKDCQTNLKSFLERIVS